ncbi:MAG: response regulator [Candidatus Dormibacteraeota bacterium]|nr:response regulator [Candidatus Dormibacteraeota bacterium]
MAESSGARPEVLLLEDDPEQLQQLAHAIREAGLIPLVAEHPRKALALLHTGRPILAVIDLDMSLAEKTGYTVEQVLERLLEDFGACTPIIYSAHVDRIEQRERVARIHPYAQIQDKKEGLAALIERLRKMLQASLGDLVVKSGRVHHQPSGKRFKHRVAVALVVATKLHRDVRLDETEARAVRRFSRWLEEEVGSEIQVRPFRNRHYDLAPRAEAGSDKDRSPSLPRQGADNQVLIVEGDADQRAVLEGMVRLLHLMPLVAATPAEAERLLLVHRPVLALVNVEAKGRGAAALDDLITYLYESFGDCLVLAHSKDLNSVRQRSRLEELHASVLVQDTSSGLEGLRERLGKLVRARFGDIYSEGGRVWHEKTGTTYAHRIALTLLMAAREQDVEVVLDQAEGRAARRLHKWLEAVGSDVRVRHRYNTYYLVLEPPQPRRRAGTKAAQVARPKKRGRPRKAPAAAPA